MTTITDMDEVPAAERAARAAIDWLILLQEGSADSEHRARFQSWLAADSGNAAAWADASGLYAMLGDTPPRHAAHWQKPIPTFSATPAPRRRIAVALLAAASVALLLFA